MERIVKVKRVNPGHYESEDGRVIIEQVEPWGGPRWEVTVDGVFVDSGWTLRDAQEYAYGRIARIY